MLGQRIEREIHELMKKCTDALLTGDPRDIALTAKIQGRYGAFADALKVIATQQALDDDRDDI
jgi:hypothetical protein